MIILMNDKYCNSRNKNLKATSETSYILITRFNMYIKDYIKGKTELDLHNWAITRFALFEAFCVASVRMQDRSTPFKWIIMADAENKTIIKLLKDAVSSMPHAQIFLSDRTLDPYANIQIAVTQACEDLSSRFVATFRLDCDDAISRIFFKNTDFFLRHVPDNAVERPFFALSFPFGMQISPTGSYALNYPSNPFIGLVEERTGILKNIYCANHGYIFDSAPVLHMHTRFPMWAQIVHGDNVMNSVYRDSLKFKCDDIEMKRIFGINFKFPKEN